MGARPPTIRTAARMSSAPPCPAVPAFRYLQCRVKRSMSSARSGVMRGGMIRPAINPAAAAANISTAVSIGLWLLLRKVFKVYQDHASGRAAELRLEGHGAGSNRRVLRPAVGSQDRKSVV